MVHSNSTNHFNKALTVPILVIVVITLKGEVKNQKNENTNIADMSKCVVY